MLNQPASLQALMQVPVCGAGARRLMVELF